jgi:hypothetical protein
LALVAATAPTRSRTVFVSAGEPAEAPGGISKDERVRPRQQRPREHCGSATQLGNGVQDDVEIRRQKRDRHPVGPAF